MRKILPPFTICFFIVLFLPMFALTQIEVLNFPEEKKAENLQKTPKQSPSEQKTSEKNIENLIYYGDLIDIDLLGSVEYDWRGEVTPEGFLGGLTFVEDSIYAHCQTEKNIARQIAKAYSKFIKNPQIVVKILDRSKRPISRINGAIKKPQRFKIKREVYLNELIILSGGFTEKASGEIRILRQKDSDCVREVEKADGEETVEATRDVRPQIIDIKISDLLKGKSESNPRILYGDIITVLKAEPIYIIGGVANPTKISMRSELTLSRAISSAGGLTKTANAQEIIIFRRESGETRIIKTNLDDIKAEKAEDIILKAFDVVEVAERGRKAKDYPPILDYEEKEQNLELPLMVID